MKQPMARKPENLLFRLSRLSCVGLVSRLPGFTDPAGRKSRKAGKARKPESGSEKPESWKSRNAGKAGKTGSRIQPEPSMPEKPIFRLFRLFRPGGLGLGLASGFFCFSCVSSFSDFSGFSGFSGFLARKPYWEANKDGVEGCTPTVARSLSIYIDFDVCPQFVSVGSSSVLFTNTKCH